MLTIFWILFILLLAGVFYVLYKDEKLLQRNHKARAKVEEYWQGQERRRYARFKKTLEVTYSVETKPHLKNSGTTANISEGGMKLMLCEKLPKGAILDLNIPIPSSGQDQTAEIEGSVVWSEEAPSADPMCKRAFCAGIKFLTIKEPHGSRLIDYIRSLAADD